MLEFLTDVIKIDVLQYCILYQHRTYIDKVPLTDEVQLCPGHQRGVAGLAVGEAAQHRAVILPG